MAESTLTVTRSDLKTAVARKLGISLDDGDWASHDSSAVTDIIEEGLRDFYSAYAWSFLRPIGFFTLPENTGDYDLPDDFGGFLGHELHYQRSDSAWYPIRLTSVAEILKHRGLGRIETTTFPSLAATTWLESSGGLGQRQSLMVWPTPSDSLVVRGQYHSIPNAISDGSPYPLGSGVHSATLRAAVLAAAEREEDGGGRVWAERFEKLLARSIRHEQETGPKHLGSMRQNSGAMGTKHDYSNHYVTYGGTAYTGP